MHKKIRLIKPGVIVIIFFVLTNPVFSQQYSAKSLVLKTTRYELDVRVDYETEKIFGRCRLTVHNPSNEAIS